MSGRPPRMTLKSALFAQYTRVNCPILCGQYKKEPLVGKIEF